MTPPWRINEILERSQNGPTCLEKDFDIKILVPKLQKVIQKYRIRFDPDILVPEDNSLADRVWQAGFGLFLDTGVYCVNTNKRIIFTENEVNEALTNLPSEFIVGSGRDATYLYQRKIGDKRKPFCFLSPDITVDEKDFVSMTMAYLQEPIADGVCAPILEEVDGQKIRTGSPLEVKGAITHAMMFREAARRVGRPGIFLKSVGTAQSAAAQIASSNQEWGERITDARFVAGLSELKTDYDLLNKMVHFNTYGCFIGGLYGPIYGGYCGGAEGTAIVGVAEHLQSLMISQAQFTTYFPFHLEYGCNTTRELLWGISVVYQALARNSNLISMSNGFTAAGPMTKMVLYEAATHALVSVASGSNLWEIAVARNKYKNRATPIEARLACEVGWAIANSQMTRKEANQLALRLIKKYESKIATAPLGKTYQECYDIEKIKPKEEYLRLYEKVKKELTKMGIKFLY